VLTAQVQERIDALFQDFAKPNTPGCALGVIVAGEMIYSRGYGTANLEYDVPITEKTVFHIASMAKQFTAMCIALLEEKGLLSLEEDIHHYFPEMPRYPWPVTVGNLVYMTNGLCDIYTLANFVVGVRENDFFTREQAWAMIKACDWLMFKPGEKWSYGNTGYFLLAELVARITGQSISEFAARNIFEPLGMNSTLFRDDRTRIIRNRAEGYSDYAHVHYNTRIKPWSTRGQKYLINADSMELPGAGQVWSTVEDLFLWDQNFYHNKLGKGSKDLITKVTTPGRLADGSQAPYAFGLFAGSKGGYSHTSHGGWANGWSCYMHRIPAKECSVICLANHTNYFLPLEVWTDSYSLPEQIMELVLPDFKVLRHSQTKIPQAAEPADWTKFLGRYQDPQDSWLLTIEVRDGRCMADLGYGRVLELRLEGDTLRALNGKETFFLDNRQVLIMQDEEEGSRREFHPFILDLAAEKLQDYTGEYRCDSLGAAYEVSIAEERLLMLNKDRRNTGVDFLWSPTVRDTFIAEYPPYCPFYCITFLRNKAGEVTAMVFRDDEGSRRENLVFRKL